MTEAQLNKKNKAELIALILELNEKSALTGDEKTEALEAENSALKEEVKTLKAVIDDQMKSLEEAKKAIPGKTVVKHDGKSYEVAYPQFSHNGKIVKAVELQGKKNIIEELVAIGSGVLVEVKN